MWFTGCVIVLKRSEPCRKLPAGKCEAASAYGDRRTAERNNGKSRDCPL